MHTDGCLSLGPCGSIQTHLTVCFHDRKLFQGLLNLWKYLGAFCMMFTLRWPCRSLGVVAVSNLVLQTKRFSAMLVVGWRSNQIFWCLPGLSTQTHQVSVGFQRADEHFVDPTLPGISAGVKVTQQKLFSVGQSLPFSCSKTTQKARIKRLKDLCWN